MIFRKEMDCQIRIKKDNQSSELFYMDYQLLRAIERKKERKKEKKNKRKGSG